MVETALICVPSRAREVVYGRALLERVLLNCERAGLKKFFIKCSAADLPGQKQALGSFGERESVRFVDSFDDLTRSPIGLSPTTPCLAVEGSLVFTKSQVTSMLERYASSGSEVMRLASTGGDAAARLTVGPLQGVLSDTQVARAIASLAGHLPYALDGHASDREEAELRLARSLRYESQDSDGPLARWLDRRVSWRISSRLARTAITPNHVTIANTVVGLSSAVMFAMPGYWTRLIAAMIFVVSTMIDGVDGELARLKLAESAFGRTLDVVTDNIVHVAVFIGLAIGCYRASADSSYLYLAPILLVGFALCALAVHRALQLRDENAQRWVAAVDRSTGRDFAYILVLLALLGHLEYFVVGTAFGTYVFALVLAVITNRKVGSRLAR